MKTGKTNNYDPIECKYNLSDCQSCIHYWPPEYLEEENQVEPPSCDLGMI